MSADTAFCGVQCTCHAFCRLSSDIAAAGRSNKPRTADDIVVLMEADNEYDEADQVCLGISFPASFLQTSCKYNVSSIQICIHSLLQGCMLYLTSTCQLATCRSLELNVCVNHVMLLPTIAFAVGVI
jgi:hypothetical protein